MIPSGLLSFETFLKYANIRAIKLKKRIYINIKNSIGFRIFWTIMLHGPISNWNLKRPPFSKRRCKKRYDKARWRNTNELSCTQVLLRKSTNLKKTHYRIIWTIMKETSQFKIFNWQIKESFFARLPFFIMRGQQQCQSKE